MFSMTARYFGARWLGSLLLLALVLPCLADEPTRTVYHLGDSGFLPTLLMRNVANQLKEDATAKVVVVANYKGVESLVAGQTDATGKPMAQWVEELRAKGVEFRVCRNSMAAFKITPDMLVPGMTTVASGVAELGRLQSKEGFGYIRP